MLGEGNFVGIVGVGLVAVDGLGLVRVFRRGDNLGIVAWLGLLRLLALLGLALLCVGGSKVGVSSSVERVGRVGVLEATKLGGRVHLWRLDRVGRLGAAGAAVAHGLTVHTGRLLGQGKGVEESARGGRGRGAKVKDPDNVEHAEQDEASSGSLVGAGAGENEVADTNTGESETGGEVAADSDMVGVNSVGCDDDKDANVEEEGVDDGPPGQLGKV